MKILQEFREFAMKGNVIDLAVGVIIGAAFGRIVTSLVEDIIMPPIGKIVGNMDFTNLYVSLSDKVDAANAKLVADATAKATTLPATQESMIGSSVASLTSFMDTATRLPLADAKKLGPVIAYGNFFTIMINFLIVAFCIFLVIKAINSAKRRFERQQAAEAAAPTVPPADVVLLTEIRDLLKNRPL